MQRCHLYLPLISSSGETYAYTEVVLLDETTGQPIDDPVYLTPTAESPQIWPVLFEPAVINLWTDRPMRVIVQAALPGGAQLTRAGVDILPAPVDTARTQLPLWIDDSARRLTGPGVLTASPHGRASWQPVDILAAHRHPGDAPASTMLGTTDLTDIYPGQTWLGGTGGVSADQGPQTVAVGNQALASGGRSVALGPAADASRQGVALGTAAVAGAESTAIGPAAAATGTGQVAVGADAVATAAEAGGIVIGPGTAAAPGSSVTVSGAVRTDADGNIVLGRGTAPDTSGLPGTAFLTLLGTAVAPRPLHAQQDVSLAGTASTLGLYGSPGTVRPILDTLSVTVGTPGRTALLSLVEALDTLGLVYDTTTATDDGLADWTRAYAHDAALALDTGDPSGYFAGDTTRIKRTTGGPAAVTYELAIGVRDFAARVFTTAPTNLAAEVTAQISADGTAWSPVPTAWRPLATTAAPWQQSWVHNARPLPFAARFLQLTLDAGSVVDAPQLGRVIVRPRKDSPYGYGNGPYGLTPYGGL